MIRTLIPWVTAAGTLTAMWLAGSGSWKGWAVGLGNQVLWAALIVTYGTWGLAPLCVALTVTYARNLLRWRREQTACADPVDDVERTVPDD